MSDEILTRNKEILDGQGRPMKATQEQQVPTPETPPLILSIFTPKDDVTAHDLAILLYYLMGGPMTQEDWDMIVKVSKDPDNPITRHLSILPNSPIVPEGAVHIKVDQ